MIYDVLTAVDEKLARSRKWQAGKPRDDGLSIRFTLRDAAGVPRMGPTVHRVADLLPR